MIAVWVAPLPRRASDAAAISVLSQEVARLCENSDTLLAMNTPGTLTELEFVLIHEREKTLRLRFRNGEIYDLNWFTVAQDFDEETPHGSATVVEPVLAPARSLRFFGPGKGMFFRLANVATVSDPQTGEVLWTEEAS